MTNEYPASVGHQTRFYNSLCEDYLKKKYDSQKFGI
jgi:hypothetical protein